MEKYNDNSILSPPMCNFYENSNIKENKENKENIDINNKNLSINMGICNKSYYSNDKYNLVSSSKKSNNNLTNTNICNINQDTSNISRQLFDSFNRNNISDMSDIVNLKIGDKSILSNQDKEKEKDKEKDLYKNNEKLDGDNNLNNINIKENLNIFENKENDKKIVNVNNKDKIKQMNFTRNINKKFFKNIKTENTDNLNIIHINNNNNGVEKGKEKEDNNIIKHFRFTFY